MYNYKIDKDPENFGGGMCVYEARFIQLYDSKYYRYVKNTKSFK